MDHSTYTPGPWTPSRCPAQWRAPCREFSETTETTSATAITNEAGEVVAFAVMAYPGWENSEADRVLRANARLLASAPALLEALEKCREELRACQAVIHLAGGFDPRYVQDAKAAMKQADTVMTAVRGE